MDDVAMIMRSEIWLKNMMKRLVEVLPKKEQGVENLRA